ncbi:hypothetical protein RRG08_060219 [Elysia crispata]|uniref:Solute carrier family 13 member 3 n=1 Tax=Elysia crispata TaxID=231223 RepID=A0AAE1DP23_9GAST|nr:hypothetical protein RRG08_060219 [Elysia crispata]
MGFKDVLREARRWQTLIIAILVPVLASPLPILIDDPAARCGYSLIVIGVYWVTEIIPLAVTALLPVLLFPLFGIMPVADVSMSYFKETVMLFLGSLIVAVAVEKWNLHKRLALRTLTLVGPQPRWLLLGVILPTWFMSMWMSNTATAAMMMPIVSAILLQIKACQESDPEENGTLLEQGQEQMVISDSTDVTVSIENGVTEKRKSSQAKKDSTFLSFAKSFSLATAYSANIGGMATLTGTPPNVIFKGLADGIYKDSKTENPVNFANWLALGVPLSIILVFSLWIWMQVYMEGVGCLKFWKKDTTNYDKVKHVLRREYVNLGKMSYAEKSVAVCFVMMALLWITRKPGFIPGWGDLFKPKYVGDSAPAVLTSIILFILPAKAPWRTCGKSRWREDPGDGEKNVKVKDKTYEKLLDWSTVNARLAWNVLLLMGGGFALADGCERSGLSAWVSSNLNGMSQFPTWTVTLCVSVIIALITEVTSNSATTTLFVPILGKTAIGMGVNPLTFMITVAIASSLAFMLPVATPPNAIVFAAGYLNITDMILAGLPMNVVSLFFLNIMMNSWAVPVYNLNVLEDAFRSSLNSSDALTSAVLPNVTPTASLLQNITGSV